MDLFCSGITITEVERLRFFFLLYFFVQKRFSTYFFNRFLNRHESTIVPFITLCPTISVQYSIKKVSRASKEYQNFKAIALCNRLFSLIQNHFTFKLFNIKSLIKLSSKFFLQAYSSIRFDMIFHFC